MILANISRLCDKRNISIAKLEREAGIGNGTIARWGDSSPRVDSLQKVANYFGVTVDELLADDGLCAEDAAAIAEIAEQHKMKNQ